MGHSQAASWKQFLLYQSQLVFALSLTKRLKKNSRLRAHKAETVLREGCQPKEPLPFPRCGDTTTRRAHEAIPRTWRSQGVVQVAQLEYPSGARYELFSAGNGGIGSLGMCQPGPDNTQSSVQQLLVNHADGKYKGFCDF